jgi:hypothetical protein
MCIFRELNTGTNRNIEGTNPSKALQGSNNREQHKQTKNAFMQKLITN